MTILSSKLELWAHLLLGCEHDRRPGMSGQVILQLYIAPRWHGGRSGDRNCVKNKKQDSHVNNLIPIGYSTSKSLTCTNSLVLIPHHFTHPSCSCASWGKASWDRCGDPSCSGCERCGSYSLPFCLETDLKVVESLFTVKRRRSVLTLFGWYI